MVNFGPLAAEIGLPVWGTPANFNGFRVFAALLHGSGRQPNFAALNRGSHICSAGQPSRQALAHILVLKNFRPEPPPSVDRPNIILFKAWFHDEMK